MTCGTAFANECDDLETNTTWQKGMNTIAQMQKQGNHEQALEETKKLYKICSLAPSLLYMTGESLEATGDKERALIYYQKATENMSQMVVEPGLARKIWYRRYELEHPERTADAISEQQSRIEELTAQAQELEKKNLELSVKDSLMTNPADGFKTLMWTGAGSAIGGAVLAIAGGTMLGVIDKNTEIRGGKAHIKSSFLTGYVLLGTGIGLTVLGSAVAGIGGYYYSKTKSNAVMSFNFTGTGASFGMTF